MAAGSTYTPIATTTLVSNQTSVTFNSFSGYTDLILIGNFKNTTPVDMNLQFNSDTAGNYSYTQMYGDGTSVASLKGTNSSGIVTDNGAAGFGTDWSNVIIHIMNYSNTTTYKTALTRNNAPISTGVTAGVWRNTNAITSLDYSASSSSAIATGSTFTLYGILAA